MKKRKIKYNEIGAQIDIAEFCSTNGTTELHVILHIESLGDSFERQYERITKARTKLFEESLLKDAGVVFQRYFLSDASIRFRS